MAKPRKIPRLDFVPNPSDYRAPGNGNRNSKSDRLPDKSLIDLSPRLELTVCVSDEAADLDNTTIPE